MEGEMPRNLAATLCSVGALLMVATIQSGSMFASQHGGNARSERTEKIPTFEYDPTWPKPLPQNWVLGMVSGTWVDARDHIWVVHLGNTLSVDERNAAVTPPIGECCVPAPPVLEFDRLGNLLQVWGGAGEGYDWQQPHGIFIDYHDHIWLGSNEAKAGQILKFTRNGKFLAQKGKPGQSKGNEDVENLNQAANMMVDPKTNELYVADGYGNRRVIVYDADSLMFKRQWGAYGNKPTDPKVMFVPNQPLPKQFNNPVHCVRMSHDDLVYVCDRKNNRVQVFKPDGTFLQEGMTSTWSTGIGGAAYDLVFSRDPEQRFLLVLDGDNKKVWILRRSDLKVVGSFGRGGHFAGQFTQPHSIASDSDGNLYIGETIEGKRVQRFKYLGLRPAAAPPA
jgi:DNA-binding beta-propeller fold protein YncE